MINDITKYPFFSHGTHLNAVFEEVTRQTSIQILGFKRIYPNLERIYLAAHRGHLVDYFQHEFYKYGFFENHPDMYQSSFHMWDHFPYDPHGIYNYLRVNHGLSHGLSVTQKHPNYCDFFIFAASSDHVSINNAYLNLKENFLNCFQRFYHDMAPIIEDVEQHRFWMPAFNGGNLRKNVKKVPSLSKRQVECGVLFLKGLTTKQIAHHLNLAPRTVEDYLTHLKNKLRAVNRVDFTLKLNKLLG